MYWPQGVNLLRSAARFWDFLAETNAVDLDHADETEPCHCMVLSDVGICDRLCDVCQACGAQEWAF